MRKSRGRGRKHNAADFILACIRLHPLETGESIVHRVMAVAPTKWSKSTLITVLSRLRSEKRVITKEWDQRTGKDNRLLVYTLSTE